MGRRSPERAPSRPRPPRRAHIHVRFPGGDLRVRIAEGRATSRARRSGRVSAAAAAATGCGSPVSRSVFSPLRMYGMPPAASAVRVRRAVEAVVADRGSNGLASRLDLPRDSSWGLRRRPHIPRHRRCGATAVTALPPGTSPTSPHHHQSRGCSRARRQVGLDRVPFRGRAALNAVCVGASQIRSGIALCGRRGLRRLACPSHRASVLESAEAAAAPGSRGGELPVRRSWILRNGAGVPGRPVAAARPCGSRRDSLPRDLTCSRRRTRVMSNRRSSWWRNGPYQIEEASRIPRHIGRPGRCTPVNRHGVGC